MNDKKASILVEAAEIAMDGWHSVEKAKAFACSVSDYLLATHAGAAAEPSDFSGDFVEHSHPQYGAGYFCTPDVFDRLSALTSAPIAPAETPPAAAPAAEVVASDLLAFVAKIANGEVQDHMFTSLEDEACSLYHRAKALLALAAKS